MSKSAKTDSRNAAPIEGALLYPFEFNPIQCCIVLQALREYEQANQGDMAQLAYNTFFQMENKRRENDQYFKSTVAAGNIIFAGKFAIMQQQIFKGKKPI